MFDEEFEYIDVAGSPRATHNHEQTLAKALDELREAEDFMLFTVKKYGDEFEVTETGVVTEQAFMPLSYKLHQTAEGMLHHSLRRQFLIMLFGGEEEIGND